MDIRIINSDCARSKQKQTTNKNRRSFNHYNVTLGTLFLVSFLSIASAMLGSSDTYATAYAMSMSSSGVSIDLSPVGSGADVVEDDVKVVSTCPSGYTLSIGGPGDTTLYREGDKVNNNTATTRISASSGTASTPVSLTGQNANTWGYSIASNPSASSASFIGLSNTLNVIASSNTATSASGDIVPVFYGASIDSTIKPGAYRMAESSIGSNDNQIVYYLTSSMDCTQYTISFDANGGSGTMWDQTIENTATDTIAHNTYIPPTGQLFKEWNTKQDGTGTRYVGGQVVTSITPDALNHVTLYAQWVDDYTEDCDSGYICYFANAPSNEVVGSMTDEYGNPVHQLGLYSTSTTLVASNYSRAGYGFAGWSTTSNYDTSNPNTKLYGPNEIINFAAGEYSGNNKGLSLYAIWEESSGSIQTDIASVCNDLIQVPTSGRANMASVAALTDQRDNQTYAFAKLPDGKCWMIENFRLNSADSQGSTNRALAQGYGNATDYPFEGLADSETQNFNENNTTENSLYFSGASTDTATGTATINIGDTNVPGARMPRYNGSNTLNRVSYLPSVNYGDTNLYSYGNYYSFSAAVANIFPFSSSYTVGHTSICPRNWRLPSGGFLASTPTDFQNLAKTVMDNQDPDQYGTVGSAGWYTSGTTNSNGDFASTAFVKFPYNYVYAGGYYGSSNDSRNNGSFLWTSSQSSIDWGWYNYMTISMFSPGDWNIVKARAFPIRCIASPSS